MPDPTPTEANIDLILGVERLLREAENVRLLRDRLLDAGRKALSAESARKAEEAGRGADR
jgi:hypothetical protein